MKKIIKNLAYLCVLTMTLLCSGCGEEQVTISGNSEENVTEKVSQQGAEEAGADESLTIHSETPEYITVFVCGAVKNEGVYELEAGSRANDGLEAAGGFSDDADTVAVNLADVLEDGQKLYFPVGGEHLPDESEAGTDASEQRLVNINSADAAELMTLPGIGETKASQIVEYRRKNGAFASKDDLKNVSGIGDSIYEKLETYISTE